MQTDTVVPVLVVGAGPTGVTAATLLARHGVRSLVVDRHVDAYPLPRAVHLDDEVLRILQQVGVAEEFTAISRPALGMRLVDGALRTVAEFRRDSCEGKHGWPQANLFDQPDLERLLRANLGRVPHATLLGGVEVESLQEISGGPAPLRALTRDVATDQRSTVWTHAVLGCDGANSITREHVGARMRSLHFEERWLVVDVRCSTQLDVWNGVYQVCDPRRATTFMQIGPDRYRWEFRLRPEESQEDLTGRAALPGLLDMWTHGIPSDELQILRQAVYTFRAAVADTWRRGRVFLLGDAAHLSPPFIGQGMGAGLRDAANLAWKLALVLGEGADERLLDSYQAERKPHVTRVIRNAVTVGWAMTGGQGRAAAVRRTLLAAACRVPGATDLALRTASPRLRAGSLVRRRFAGDPLPGTVCPQPWLDFEGRRRRLDDVLGDSFAVISAGPVPSAFDILARRLRASIVRLGPQDPLADWLRRSGAQAVLLRPDRVVLATVSADGLAGADIALAAAWLPLMPVHRTDPVHTEDLTLEETA